MLADLGPGVVGAVVVDEVGRIGGAFRSSWALSSWGSASTSFSWPGRVMPAPRARRASMAWTAWLSVSTLLRISARRSSSAPAMAASGSRVARSLSASFSSRSRTRTGTSVSGVVSALRWPSMSIRP
ncbi:MAG: hypothetical protein EDX89_22905 [Acidobacteria bacterium]|nr:MAG: hypothetical protein EDX89_22905 [Acidobacteriota bacterium]